MFTIHASRVQGKDTFTSSDWGAQRQILKVLPELSFERRVERNE